MSQHAVRFFFFKYQLSWLVLCRHSTWLVCNFIYLQFLSVISGGRWLDECHRGTNLLRFWPRLLQDERWETYIRRRTLNTKKSQEENRNIKLQPTSDQEQYYYDKTRIVLRKTTTTTTTTKLLFHQKCVQQQYSEKNLYKKKAFCGVFFWDNINLLCMTCCVKYFATIELSTFCHCFSHSAASYIIFDEVKTTSWK